MRVAAAGPLVAVVAVGVWLSVARVGQARARRVLGARGVARVGWVPRGALARRHRVPLAVLGGGSVASLVLGSPVPVVLALPGAWVLRRRRERAVAEGVAGAVRCGVVGLCAALAGELRAGRAPEEALAAAARAVGGPVQAVIGEAVGSARVGGDVPDALERAAGRPGAAGLRRIAACWRIATGRGGGFAPALERIAATLRAEEDAREEVAAELAGARSTAHVLAGLPVFGLFLGSGLGARPVDVLLRTPAGIGCLCGGLALVLVGLEWTDRLVARAVPTVPA
ncbi:type II secretion system F family protein [Embleya sp. NBC_00896]|uniref:type II secretion system F family protein n=1 Tax=Embleya sp. NBC_00896 TaxID=2975961 RepID=UPI0038688461|nr:type II secretion system F family protein [Embleya sp. NBC_00896]